MHASKLNTPSSAPFRILSLDGGGIRGYYTARLLARLLKHFEISTGKSNRDLGKGFDLIAGTSTGGILGAALACGKRPEIIARLYKDKGPSIFAERFPKIEPTLGTFRWAYDHWNKPTASQALLRKELTEVFGDCTLHEVWNRRKIGLVLPSISVERYSPKVFKTPHLADLTHDRQVKLVNACLATSAAPLYFPLHPISEKDGYCRNDHFVDGGLWANNPSLVGLTEALQILALQEENRPIHLISIGTCGGLADQSHLIAHPEGGLKTWNFGKDLIELSLTSAANSAAFTTGLLASALTKFGQPVVYLRLPEPAMTSEQQACLGLDKADTAAFELMDELAANSEGGILSAMKNPTNTAYDSLQSIFLTLPNSVLDHPTP